MFLGPDTVMRNYSNANGPLAKKISPSVKKNAIYNNQKLNSV